MRPTRLPIGPAAALAAGIVLTLPAAAASVQIDVRPGQAVMPEPERPIPPARGTAVAVGALEELGGAAPLPGLSRTVAEVVGEMIVDADGRAVARVAAVLADGDGRPRAVLARLGGSAAQEVKSVVIPLERLHAAADGTRVQVSMLDEAELTVIAALHEQG